MDWIIADWIFAGLEGVIRVCDDFLIYGKNLDEHDNNPRRFLSRCVEFGLTLGLEKSEFCKDRAVHGPDCQSTWSRSLSRQDFNHRRIATSIRPLWISDLDWVELVMLGNVRLG